MREIRKTVSEVRVGDMIVKVGTRAYDSRVVEVRPVAAGTRLTGPRGGAKVMNAHGEAMGATAFVLKNGKKPVAYADTTVVVRSDGIDW